MELVRIGEAAKMTGLHQQTLRRLAADGEVPVSWSPSGKERRFDKEDLRRLMGRLGTVETVRVEAHYVRVSGATGQETSLADQEAELSRTATGVVYKVYRDRGSGLAEGRRGLQRLLRDAEVGRFNVVRVTYPDRLARFGVTWLEMLLADRGVALEALDDARFKSPQAELMSDFMSLIASFSGKFYKLRSWENQQRLVNVAAEALAIKAGERE
ncbi:MAG: IS607 family transposase [Candidatus Dormibacteria bacterium]